MSTNIKQIRINKLTQTLENLVSFLESTLPFLNSHFVEHFTRSHFETFLPNKVQSELDKQISIDHLKCMIHQLAKTKSSDVESDVNVNVTKEIYFNNESNPSIHEIFSKVASLLQEGQNIQSQCHMINDKITFISNTNCESENENQSLPSNFTNKMNLNEGLRLSNLKFDKFMTAKKMHEVELMGDLIYKMSKCNGKGEFEQDQVKYLIDVGSGKGYLSSYMKLFYKFNVLAIDSNSINTIGCEKRSEKLEKQWHHIIRRAVDRSNGIVPKKRGKKYRSQLQPSSSSEDNDDNGENGEKVVADSAKLKNVTMFVSQELNIEDVIRSNFQIEDNSNSRLDYSMIGLHTCGHLGSNSLKIFVESPLCKSICNVPCCFHLFEEEFIESDFWINEDKALYENHEGYGFPLSSLLRQKKFYLGRNARMISSHSIEKMVENESGLDLPTSLFYRTLLQVLVRDKVGSDKLEHKVGRGVGAKFSSNFTSYIQNALKRLHLEHLKVSDEEIQNLYVTYEPLKTKLHSYFLLRTVLGTLVENCILLDRLAYLLEQENVKDAHIIQLFDPAISPRSTAIIAMK